jgi:hypothetical protein
LSPGQDDISVVDGQLKVYGIANLRIADGSSMPRVTCCRKGKITLLRESLNTVAAAQALNPNGVADLPPLESEIFSVPPGYLS